MDAITSSRAGAAGRRPPRGHRDAGFPRPRTWTAARLLPLIGPLALYIVWDRWCGCSWSARCCCHARRHIGGAGQGHGRRALLGDFLASVNRTLQAFVIAGVIGVPLGVLLGSNEKAYRSVEFRWTSSVRRRRRH